MEEDKDHTDFEKALLHLAEQFVRLPPEEKSEEPKRSLKHTKWPFEVVESLIYPDNNENMIEEVTYRGRSVLEPWAKIYEGEEGLDLIPGVIQSYLLAHEVSELDVALDYLHLEGLSSHKLISILANTWGAADRLSSREGFIARASSYFEDSIKDLEEDEKERLRGLFQFQCT